MAGERNPTESVAVVAVPCPAQGHLNQMLHLSLLLASRGLDVHYAAPAPSGQQARARVHGWDEAALLSIRFHDLGVSPFFSLSVAPPPDPAAAAAAARAPLAALLDGLSASRRRVVVVYDLMYPSAAAEEAARLPNGEAFGLHCTAVSYLLGRMDRGHRLLRDNGLDHLPYHAWVEHAGKRTGVAQSVSPGAGIITNTCRALEGEFVDAVAEQLAGGGKKLFAVGPLNPLPDAAARKQGKPRHACLDWLDKQPPRSVVYVSFGSTCSLRVEQVAELAAALRGSKRRFIWVLRDADGDTTSTADAAGDDGRRRADLLSEFTNQTKGAGLVITEWALQLEILAHGATAAFVSHCGWNSTMESMSHGKPILAWPMRFDQPWDADLVCNYLRAGLLVRPWEKRGEVTPAATIQEAIEMLMDTDEGLAVRQRAEALGEAVRSCAALGGPSRRDLEGFVAHITW